MSRYQQLNQLLAQVSACVSYPQLRGVILDWCGEALYQHVLAPHRIERVLTIPLVNGSGLAGVMNLARTDRSTPYDDADVRLASGLAAQISVAASRVDYAHEDVHLTPRELDVCQLAAAGASAFPLRSTGQRGRKAQCAPYPLPCF